MPFERVGPQPLYREVQRQVEQYIAENHLRPGDRLPKETEIMERVGVSRNVVREALKGLEAVGLLEVRMGSGYHVAKFDAAKYLGHYSHSVIVDGIDLDELWSVRRVLELGFIERAAEVIGETDLAELDRLLADLEKASRIGTGWLLAGLRLHQATYRCLQNRVLDTVLHAFVEIFDYAEEPLVGTIPEDVRMDGVSIHRAIVEALRRHDPEGARSALEADSRVPSIKARIGEAH
jgi:DNA-binding FadR family transcriptional regulator